MLTVTLTVTSFWIYLLPFALGGVVLVVLLLIHKLMPKHQKPDYLIDLEEKGFASSERVAKRNSIAESSQTIDFPKQKTIKSQPRSVTPEILEEYRAFNFTAEKKTTLKSWLSSNYPILHNTLYDKDFLIN